jgi:hypothetical protein
VGIGLRDPRSQKRDLGHPSISPFDIAEGTSFVISLLMTKEREGFPVGIGLRDPRSQKRDLGHPSISPFDFALRFRPSISPFDFTLRFHPSISPFDFTLRFHPSMLQRAQALSFLSRLAEEKSGGG